MTDRDAILARRRRLIALALAGGAAATTAACSPCLAPRDSGTGSDGGTDASFDASPVPCLSRPPDDAPDQDAGVGDADGEVSDAGADASSGADE